MPISDFDDMFPSTVVHKLLLSRDSFGKPTYESPGTTHKGRVIDKPVMFRNAQGQEIHADGMIIINGTPAISPADLVSISGGSSVGGYGEDGPVIVFIKRSYDEIGPHHTRIFWGNTMA